MKFAPGSPARAELETRDFVPGAWPDLERLFGTNGACGGCYCMYWRLERGEKWDELKGEEAKRRMQELVTAGRAHFVIAYRGGEPVGFCAYGKRKDFPRLDRSGSFVCDDADRVWSIPCFFVKRQHRGTGVAGALLAGALRVISARGGRIAEGYPVKPAKDGKSMPAAFAWTGTRSLFQKAGFEVTGNPDGGKQRVRKEV